MTMADMEYRNDSLFVDKAIVNKLNINGNQIDEEFPSIKEDVDIINQSVPYFDLSSDILSSIDTYRNKICKNEANNLFSFGWITDVHLSLNNLGTCLKRLYTFIIFISLRRNMGNIFCFYWILCNI